MLAAVCSGTAVPAADGTFTPPPVWSAPGAAVASDSATYPAYPTGHVTAPAAAYAYPPAVDDRPPAGPALAGDFPNARFDSSGWYLRVDYFDWYERVESLDFVQESGPLVTLGHETRAGPERFRVELFAGDVDYLGLVRFAGGDELVPSHTGYFGGRAEYELLFGPRQLPNVDFFVGLGGRLWLRDLPDTVAPSGGLVIGYQETWLTVYPYVGAEATRPTAGGGLLFASIRGGVTPLTWEHVSLFDSTLNPECGALARAVLGYRGRRLCVSGVFELMSWNESDPVRGVFQPYSRMFQAGLELGWTF